MTDRNRRPLVRVLTGVILVTFVFVATVTTVVSVGRYCLTSNGADTSSLPDRRP